MAKKRLTQVAKRNWSGSEIVTIGPSTSDNELECG